MKNLIEYNSVKQKQDNFIGGSRCHKIEYRKELYDKGENHDRESATV